MEVQSLNNGLTSSMQYLKRKIPRSNSIVCMISVKVQIAIIGPDNNSDIPARMSSLSMVNDVSWDQLFEADK